MQIKKFETTYAGERLIVELTDLADQANGSVLVRYGETAVFATAVMGKKREGIDYFPLSVDYEEKFYAAGMILGSRFMRREGRPSEEAVLSGRLIDRTIRPLFNKKIRNEVQVTTLILSVDGKNDPDVPAIVAASLALGLSDIPWKGPVGAVRMGYVNGEFVANPKNGDRDASELDLVACGREGMINMVEAGAKELPEDIVYQAMEKALEEITKIENFQKELIAKEGKKKIEVELEKCPDGLQEFFEKEMLPAIEDAIYNQPKGALYEAKDKWLEIYKEKYPEEALSHAEEIFEEETTKIIQNNIIDAENGKEKRADGRKLDEIRPLYAGVGLLPISHGSGVFFRGGTHVLSVVTLGGPKDAQLIEGMEVQMEKHFMHHYNFPPFSTGETGRMGSPGRREIGHGALVERALSAVIPDREIFPYTIRIVSESLASNGSTSMGSTCASTLALMDAGVPIKAPVTGMAMGIVVKGDKYKILTDIQGIEDHYGGMDFKCPGTAKGITAIQLDLKLEGLTLQMLKDAMELAKTARAKVLDVVLQAISAPRPELAPSAPIIVKVMINPEKIGEVIGPGGKVINSITEKTGTDINIEQDGTVLITGKTKEGVEEAKKIVEGIVKEFEVGEMITGPVSRLFEFGAMVQISPNEEGLIHISELAPFRVDKVTDIVNIGDVVTVKVSGIDEKGRINLSLKQADPNYNPELDKRGEGPQRRTPYGGGRPHGGGRPMGHRR